MLHSCCSFSKELFFSKNFSFSKEVFLFQGHGQAQLLSARYLVTASTKVSKTQLGSRLL